MSSKDESTNQAQTRLEQVQGHTNSSNMGSVGTSATHFSEDACPQAAEDPLFGLMAAYRRDTFDKKVDLGIGAYRDNNAKPWVLTVVKKADALIRDDPNLNHEYLPIAGLPEFTLAAQKLILGPDSPAIKEGRAASFQTVSGTGAVHLGALFLAKFSKSQPTVYLSSPTWANHNQIFSNVGVNIKSYPYFDKKTKMLDFDGMLSTIKSAPTGSVILLHPCAHNPTGVDPTKEQWQQIAKVMKEKDLFPFLDCAYQGFATGSLSQDNYAIRHFIEQGFELCVCQSFAKNFGLYGQRAGAFHWVVAPGSDGADAVKRIASQLAILQRSEISNPPAYGARIASKVLNDPELFAQWEDDLRTMSGRIIEMRKALKSELDKLETPGTWDHVTSQIGMFSFTGLSEAQVKQMQEKHHVYMTKNGRISMAGLNTNNVQYFAKAVDDVVRNS
ncbi:Aspartate aminotransferase, cytoplasmic [Exophiala xenobiotica]|uniref:Aspartate aminotransferase n=1 Tax=Lithohypha guttulata TaxID=1690604 RepID=A0ABR0K1Z7_9EURO|nr:Aspartate aminotransferase, cytoplasmic [Lithohypha guttulata]KAK5312372.1 Aspartate aminotransferase, cytoplasmic [Exophiala xenobiotica]